MKKKNIFLIALGLFIALTVRCSSPSSDQPANDTMTNIVVTDTDEIIQSELREAAPMAGTQQVKIVKVIFATPEAKAQLSRQRDYEFIVHKEDSAAFAQWLDRTAIPQLIPYLQAKTITAAQIFPPYQLYIGNVTVFFYLYVELGEDWGSKEEVKEYALEYLAMVKTRFTNKTTIGNIIMTAKTPLPTTAKGISGSYEQDYTVSYTP